MLSGGDASRSGVNLVTYKIRLERTPAREAAGTERRSHCQRHGGINDVPLPVPKHTQGYSRSPPRLWGRLAAGRRLTTGLRSIPLLRQALWQGDPSTGGGNFAFSQRSCPRLGCQKGSAHHSSPAAPQDGASSQSPQHLTLVHAV